MLLFHPGNEDTFPSYTFLRSRCAPPGWRPVNKEEGGGEKKKNRAQFS